MATSRITSSSTDCATMMISGHRYPLQNSAIALLRRHGAVAARERGTFRHDGGRARDRIGEIEVGHGRTEWRLVRRAAKGGELLDIGRIARLAQIDLRQVRVRFE